MVIKINNDKCLGAKKCGKCLHICPLGVLMNVPVGNYKPHNLPEKYKIVPFFMKVCNGCRACERICPEDCIRVL